MDKPKKANKSFVMILVVAMTFTSMSIAKADSHPIDVFTDEDAEESGNANPDENCGCTEDQNDTNPPGGDTNNTGSGDSSTSDADLIINGQAWCSPNTPASESGDLGGFASGICTWICGDDSITFLSDGNFWGTAIISPGSNGVIDFETNGVYGLPMNDNLVIGVDDAASIYTCGDWNTTAGGSRTIFDICWRKLYFTGVGIGCGGDYDVEASVSIPCSGVTRSPYPRGLVNTPNVFTVSSTGRASASGTRNYCEPYLRDYKIQLEWVQLPISPVWTFNERPWSTTGNAAVGFEVAHTYDTASFGMPQNGPSTYGVRDLPSYQVNVRTYWMARVRESWREWDDFSFDCDPLNANYYSCITEQTYCDSLFSTIDDDRCGRWRKRSSGWIDIDLRLLGSPTYYAIRNGGIDMTEMPPQYPEALPLPTQCVISVPIIESQGLLSSP